MSTRDCLESITEAQANLDLAEEWIALTGNPVFNVVVSKRLDDGKSRRAPTVLENAIGSVLVDRADQTMNLAINELTKRRKEVLLSCEQTLRDALKKIEDLKKQKAAAQK